MIESFKCRETEKIYNRFFSKKLPNKIQRQALKKLLMVHRAQNINDLRTPPSNHLEELKGNRKGQHSIRINNQYRVCFMWIDNGAREVEIVDYHKG